MKTSIAIGLLLLLTDLAHAAVPAFVTYSGRLTDGTAAGQSAILALRFAIYDQAEGGTARWSSPELPVAVDDGYFSVTLREGTAASGSTVAVTTVFAAYPTTWIGVAVGAGPDLAPRQAVGSVPYAAQCGDAESMSGSTLSELDDRFVHTTGDTMDGTLLLPVNGLKVGATQLVTANGNLGIGTASPSQRLTVVNGSIKVETTIAGEAGVLLKTPTSDWLVMTNDAWAGGDVVFFNNETSKSAVRISEAGTVTMLGACDDVGSGQCANDVAESFEAVEAVEPGDVVALDPSGFKAIGLATKPYDPLAVGVVSTAPTLTMGSTHGLSDVPVALAGVVPVKASLENGPIRPGDLLTSSSAPGLAMRATRQGPIVGKAMSEVGTDGRVWALIGGAGGGCPNEGNLRAEVQRQRTQLDAQRQAIDTLRAEVEALKARR